MGKTIKQFLTNAITSVEIGYRVVRGIDYQTLSQYILRINTHKDIDSILAEVSQCLQDILGYELFGFGLKTNESLDIWIDPRIYSDPFADYVKRDFLCQNIDHKMHFLVNQTEDIRHKIDTQSMADIISYKVMDGSVIARMYILPKRHMLNHHNSIISTIVRSLSIALEKSLSIRDLENAVAVDPLTNCYNRRALDNFIENDIAYARRHKTNLAVIMFDLDNFKKINDLHGHLVGDIVLKEIAGLITSQVRKSDYLVRYGGEEFVLVLPDSTLYDAVLLAHKLRKTVAGHTIEFPGSRLLITASFGVASLEDKQDSSGLLQEADERMYKAKTNGKNAVVPSLLPCFADRRFMAPEQSRKYSTVNMI
jgi:diguanylate cyclase (GGDEF)-like protein